MSKKRGIMNNYGELTPFLKNIIIVASLFISIVIVLVVVYNIVSRDTEIKKAEESVDLNIVKSSVKIDNGLLKLSVSGTLEKLELKKVKFIINDGTNEENISLDAFNFETQKSFEIDLKKLGIDYTKKITISIKPIIKKLTGEKELKVTDKISLSPTGETKQEEIPAVEEEKISTTITSCDKCGGLLGKGCDKILCHSISEGCYYKGGFTRECASCSEMGCEQYKTQTDCSSNKCKLGSCIWENKECIKNPECGNGIVNASANEECDDGNIINTDVCTNYCKNAICGDGYIRTGIEQCDKGGANGIACTPAYGGGTCTYCSSECTSVVLTGGTCGDNICTTGSETPANCPADCVGCGDGTCAGGETCNSCSSDCGLCCGNGVCDSSYGENVANCLADCKRANGETCSTGTECQSGYCYIDNDNDRYAPATGTKTCEANSQLSGTDCDDTNNGVYQLLTCYTDGDGDSYGAGSSISVCATSCGAGKVTNNQDCNDANPSVWQLLNCYTDSDGDGYGAGAIISSVCATSCGAGKSSNNADCLDSDNQVNPGATYHTTQHATRGWDWDCDNSITKLNDGAEWYQGIYNCVTCSATGSSGICSECPYASVDISCTQLSLECGQYVNYQICYVWRCSNSYNCQQDALPLISGGSGIYGIKSAELRSIGYTESCR